LGANGVINLIIRDKEEIIHIEPGFILIGKPYIIVPVYKFSLMLLNIKMFIGDQSLV
jgi:hypothetical protein